MNVLTLIFLSIRFLGHYILVGIKGYSIAIQFVLTFVAGLLFCSLICAVLLKADKKHVLR